MPVLKKFNRPGMFGPSNIFCITDWKGFLGALDNEAATITGTINEVATPWGTGIEVGVLDSNVKIEIGPPLPIGTAPSSLFILYYLVGANHATSWWGSGGVTRRTRSIFPGVTNWTGALWADDVVGDVLSIDQWTSVCHTVPGTNGSTQRLYENGLESGTDVLNGDCITDLTELTIFAKTNAGSPAPAGSIMQVILIFNSILTAGDVLALHNDIMGLGTNP